MNGDVLVAGDQDGADLAQGDGGTMQVASAGTGDGDVGAEGVDPRGAAGLLEDC